MKQAEIGLSMVDNLKLLSTYRSCYLQFGLYPLRSLLLLIQEEVSLRVKIIEQKCSVTRPHSDIEGFNSVS